MHELGAAMKNLVMNVLLGLGTLFALSGCLQVKQVIHLEKDGSGRIVEEIMMGAQMAAMVDMAAAQGGAAGGQNPMGEIYNEAAYRKKAAGFGEGTEFVGMEKVEGKGVRVTYKFADINKLVFEPGSTMDTLKQPGQPDPAGEPLKFTYHGGKLTIDFPEFPDGEGIGDAGGVDPNDPEAMAMMQMFAEMKISSSLVVEGGITETNATYRDGNRITLMEIVFKELLASPDGARVLRQVDGKNRDEARRLLKGVRGVKIETRDPVTVR